MSMPRCCAFIAAFILALVLPLAAKEPTLQELIARANTAPLKEQPGLCVEIAERQLKLARELYDAGKPNEGKASVADLVTYSQKAHDAAVQSGKRLKQTEMAARKMSRQLLDMKRTLNFEDQAPVQAAADRLETLAQDLLAHMFGKEK